MRNYINRPEDLHPFLPLLQTMFPDLVEVRSGSFLEDLQTVLCAKHLVVSRSTLEHLILWHNDQLESVYAEALAHMEQSQAGFPEDPAADTAHFHQGYPEACHNRGAGLSQLVSMRPQVAFYLMPHGPYYSLYSNWTNSFEQRLEMLHYQWPADASGAAQPQRCIGTTHEQRKG
jgi:hypothetical protein